MCFCTVAVEHIIVTVKFSMNHDQSEMPRVWLTLYVSSLWKYLVQMLDRIIVESDNHHMALDVLSMTMEYCYSKC